MNEIHDHKEELRSSNVLLAALQKSERRASYGEERGYPTAARKLVLPRASRKLLRALPAILFVILWSRKRSFLVVGER